MRENNLLKCVIVARAFSTGRRCKRPHAQRNTYIQRRYKIFIHQYWTLRTTRLRIDMGCLMYDGRFGRYTQD